ncbi:MarR family winged helix-turn-helix transcriptional regulator [Pararhodobacter sp.]|uniref:MarR family winged helix-turn-helix transcriptional regulator n=1 Tax=Pararhodobacter sp. TaxID=2127056 RepID=UPI002AFEA9DA|nr:MarR family transcriptional regulator [Pararhodobacter sp.]
MSIVHSMPGFLIRRLNQISMSVFQERMQRLGLDLTSVQFAALVALSENPGIDQATLAGLIAYDRVTIGGVVDRLVAKDLVARQINPQDRRARQLALTDSGATLLTRLIPEVQALQHDILAGLSAEEVAAFITLAKRTTEAGNDRSRAPLRPRD